MTATVEERLVTVESRLDTLQRLVQEALSVKRPSDIAVGGTSQPLSLARLIASLPTDQRKPLLEAALGSAEPEPDYDKEWVDLDEDYDC